MSYFRPDPWIPETIRHVPHRVSFVGLTGGYSGSEKVELVGGMQARLIRVMFIAAVTVVCVVVAAVQVPGGGHDDDCNER